MIKRRDPFDEFAVLIRGETATALGLAGRKLQQALDELAAFDRDGPKNRYQQREDLVREAAATLYGYVIQKELNGIADHEALNKAYAIPAEIWQQMGGAG
ncbi:MAG: hypothetical protein JWQ90_3697 [Hydrocarboniphaga sp.]|uniref:hypothetical protein n=1 Tax=Hydrocarboniphaga sp. TaxID=2033016 RepID=UPI00261084BB|nr:hypothetical protein [Hydrocarboniphaga sp.]MDB5971247.1 hypothetical protein [Hydrocarboniphaga sp.]